MKLVNRLFMTLAVLCLVCPGIGAVVNPKPFMIPELKEWKGTEGVFVPTEATEAVCPANQSELLRTTRILADDCETMLGYKPGVVQGKGGAGDVILAIRADKKLGKEGYTVEVTDCILLTVPESIGVYWGARTLLQIAEQSENHQFPKGTLRDFPDYVVRGFMIDCGRKLAPLAFLQDCVKIMAYYKMNTLRIHLNDNGFKQYFEHDWSKAYAASRLESDTYPGLTTEDGYYTKREFIDSQKLAENLYVEIIPEIDAPAHTFAFAHYKPEIGSKEYGMDHLDLFNPETYKFMDGLFKEYLKEDGPVFRGKKVHIGTNEYSNKKKDVVEKFHAFTDHYIRYVESFGKQAYVWGALTHAKGDTPVKSENVIMSARYNGYTNPKDMIEQGYKLISIPDGLIYIVPAAGYYYDYLSTKYLYENWTPVHIGKAVFSERDPSILGGMFVVWDDHVGNGISTKDIHHRVYPTLQTLAVKMWTGKDTFVLHADSDRQCNAISEAPDVNQLERISIASELVYGQASAAPDSKTPHRGIGYDHLVTFDIDGVDETEGTELFHPPDAVFYLSDPIRGMLDFARDGYLNTFSHRIYKGEKATIGISGDNKSTRLLINGQVVEEMNTQKLYYNAGKDSMNYVRTLVSPLEKAGRFDSEITDLKVYRK